MEAAAAPSANKRRAEAAETGTSSTPATAATETPTPEATPIKKTAGARSSQEPPPPGGAGGDQYGNGGGVDRISGLPDAILGDIVSLLPTKEAARTQVLASRWAHLWRAAPLNLDSRDLPHADDEVLAGVVSRILSTHHGPGRLFRVPAHHLHDRAATVDAWLCSPALDNLEEIEFCDRRWPAPEQPPTPPASAFRFWATLRAATIGECHVPDGGPVQGIRFPQLQQLALVRVRISEGSLHGMISSASCPALEYLFLDSSHGFRCVRINSTTLRSIGLRTDYYGPGLRFQELVIEDAPCLDKLLCAERVGFRVSVVAARRLETLGSLSNWSSSFSTSRHAFGSTVFQELHLGSFTSVVGSVKILSVDFCIGNLDMVIDLMKCFPCLEKLYVKGSLSGRREKNLWRRKHRQLTQCFDSHVKTLVLEKYEGIRSHISFASFFLLNARELQLMRLEVEQKNCNEEFFAQQRLKLQLEGRACRGARLDFALNRCHCRIIHIDHVHDLTIADPFECTC